MKKELIGKAAYVLLCTAFPGGKRRKIPLRCGGYQIAASKIGINIVSDHAGF